VDIDPLRRFSFAQQMAIFLTGNFATGKYHILGTHANARRCVDGLTSASEAQ